MSKEQRNKKADQLWDNVMGLTPTEQSMLLGGLAGRCMQAIESNRRFGTNNLIDAFERGIALIEKRRKEGKS